MLHGISSCNMMVFKDSLKSGSPYYAETPRKYHCIFIVKKGQLLYENAGQQTVIETGQIGFIAAGSLDKSSAFRCAETSYIGVEFEPCREQLPFQTLCSNGKTYEYDQLFQQMLDNYLFPVAGNELVFRGIFLQILGLLTMELHTDMAMRKKMQKIEAGVEFLKNHFHQKDFKIADAAQATGMSEKNFRRIFAEVYRKTPYTFLGEFRISHAKIHLARGVNSISEIALLCGFSDVYSFSHAFKNQVGMSPSAYAKQKML